MITNIIILSLTLISLTFGFLYLKLRKKTKKIIQSLDKPIRKGYYKNSSKYGLANYEIIVYVTEIDRYTNGESKINLETIEVSGSIINSYNIDILKKIATNKFSHIVKTSDIYWMESEIEIKEQRREKLKQLKALIK
jgi:hypothetical protein